jgi:hypothetical protein
LDAIEIVHPDRFVDRQFSLTDDITEIPFDLHGNPAIDRPNVARFRRNASQTAAPNWGFGLAVFCALQRRIREVD